VVQTPYQAPNANAYAERFVRSIKEECLNRVIPFGERHLRRTRAEYVEHYHREHNRQGIENELISGSSITTLARRDDSQGWIRRLGPRMRHCGLLGSDDTRSRARPDRVNKELVRSSRASRRHPRRCILLRTRSVKSTMLKKLCATVLLVLAVSPFTAPFQTFDFVPLCRSANDEAVLVVPTAATSASIANDAGSLVAPPAARLQVVPPSTTPAFRFVVARPVAFLISSVASTNCISGHASLPTPLRL